MVHYNVTKQKLGGKKNYRKAHRASSDTSFVIDDAKAVFGKFKRDAATDKDRADCRQKHHDAKAACKDNLIAARKDVCCESDSEHSETERKALLQKAAKKDKKAHAKAFSEDDFKKQGQLCKKAEQECENAEDKKAFAKKDQRMVQERDKSAHKKKKFHVRKFYEKKWEEDCSNSEDERKFKKDNRKAAKKARHKDEASKAAAVNRNDTVRKERERKAAKDYANRRASRLHKSEKYHSESDAEHSAKRDSRAFKKANKKRFAKKDKDQKKNLSDRKHAHTRLDKNNKKWAKYHKSFSASSASCDDVAKATRKPNYCCAYAAPCSFSSHSSSSSSCSYFAPSCSFGDRWKRCD
jgi:hypothetical protein